MIFYRNLTGTETKGKLKRAATTHSLGRRSASKPIIFVLPQASGEPTLYKVDPDKMQMIRDVAESIKVPDDHRTSSQSLPMSSRSSLLSDMDTDSGRILEI